MLSFPSPRNTGLPCAPDIASCCADRSPSAPAHPQVLPSWLPGSLVSFGLFLSPTYNISVPSVIVPPFFTQNFTESVWLGAVCQEYALTELTRNLSNT